jgi:hypothetical protein
MNPAITLTDIAVFVNAFVVAVGLGVRGRWRLSVAFTAYLLVIFVRGPLNLFWPEPFFHLSYWLAFQSVLDILKFGIVLEVGWRTFRQFPGAASVARKAGLLILALTAMAVVSVSLVSANATSAQAALANLHPRLLDGTIWLMAAVLVIARWYRVPVHGFHAALLTSLALYLVFFTWLLRLYAGHEFEVARGYLNALDPVVFFLVTCWWIHLAWRTENEADRSHTETLRTLQLGVLRAR